MNEKLKALVVVAHPDDEVLWTGGYIMRHREYEWNIIAVCYSDYLPRARAFVKSCHSLNVYQYENYNFVDNFNEGELRVKLEGINFNDYSLIITHDPNYGEYSNNDHKKVGKIVNELAKNPKEILNFAYKNFQYPEIKIDVSDPTRYDKGSQEFPSVNKEESDILLFLTHEELSRKLYILQKIYLEQKVDFRNLSWSCPNPEAFKIIKKDET